MQTPSTEPPDLASSNSELSIREFIAQCGEMMIPVNNSVSYFCAVHLEDKQFDRLVADPTSALPARLFEYLPKLRLVLVPYLEATPNEDRESDPCRIVFEEPEEKGKLYTFFESREDEHYVFLAINDEDLFDSHVLLYATLAREIVNRCDKELIQQYNKLLMVELDKKAHGEVHESSWKLKRELLRSGPGSEDWDTLLDHYSRCSLEDTLILYLHGLCCDIDIESGPKQLASQHLRARLLLLKELLPPPEGVALLPEDLATAG